MVHVARREGGIPPTKHCAVTVGVLPSGTLENETSSAGLRPEGIYVYVERSQERANRPFLEGEHGCPDRDRTLEGKPALDGK